MSLDLSELLKYLLELLDLTQKLFIIVAGIIAVLSYISEKRQRGINNSLNSLTMFKNTINKEDIDIWKDVYFNTYEGTGAAPNHFFIFSKENERIQIPLSNLFIPEGRGLMIPDSKLSLDREPSDLELGSIRRIAEQLNLISYEVLYGNVELRIIYYELGQIIRIMYTWITTIQDKYEKRSVEFRFSYFIKMCQKYKREMAKLPKKEYVVFD